MSDMILSGLFHKSKNTSGGTPLKNKLRDLKCRKISFVDCDFSELELGMKNSSDYILKLNPVNYYAVKNNYILASLYSSEDFSECYVVFKRISYEKATDESDIYTLGAETAVKALAKVGIIINLRDFSDQVSKE